MASAVRMVSEACAGPLVERIHRHLDIGELDAGAVRLDANFDVEVDHPFHGHQNFHKSPSQTNANKSGRKLMAAALACQRLCCAARNACCMHMTFSENRYPLFGVMR